MRLKKSKRLVSLLLAGSMMVSMVPAGAVTAFAAEAKSGVVAYAGETQGVAVTVDNFTTGQLKTAVEEQYATLDDITSLTVSGGTLGKDDYAFLSGTQVTGDQSDRYTYSVKPDGLTYLKNLKEVDLSGADCENGFILGRAFFKNDTITKIVLPHNTKRIGMVAFALMPELSYLSMDKNTNLRFEGVEILGESMASGDKKLVDSLELPSSLQAIGDSCFRNSGVSGNIVIRPNVNITTNVDYVSGNAVSEELSRCQFAGTAETANTPAQDGTDITSLVFESGVEKIPGLIALNCKKLTKVVIPDTVDEIGAQAFSGAALSGTLILSKTVATVAERAFYNNNDLDTVIVENPDVSVGWQAFYDLKDNAKIYFTAPVDNAINGNSAAPRWNASKTIILNTNGGTITHDSNGNVTAKTDSNGFYIPVKDNEKFVAWKTTDNGKTYTAKWKAKERYTVTFDLNGHGDSATKTVYEDDTVTKPADPTAKGYKFAGWYVDEDCTTAFDFATSITANTTVYAKWEKIPDHQLTVIGGTFTVKDETVEIKTEGDKLIANVPEGAEVTVTFNKAAYADSNLVFGGWEISGLDDKENYANKEEFTFTMPETGVTIEAMPKTADTEDDSWDAATVITGVAIGAGAAVLTYHIGTELYAEQVLGKGVAVPKTREDVALKAWELAGKPAVELNGEPLSEAAQAEKWAVESGLMQNDAEGNFNGAKKMNKLKALRVLDAAKKLG